MYEAPKQTELSQHTTDYLQVIKNRYGVVLLTLFLVFMTSAVITYVMPKKFESSATIEVKPRERAIDPLGGMMRENGPMMTPQFFATEFEKIKSRNSLGRIINSLDLTSKWSMDYEMVIKKLKNIVDTQNIRGTDLIEITVRDESKEDARDIAAEVALSYKDYRNELESRIQERGNNEIRKAVLQQEDRVEDRRKVLSTISRNKKIIYYGDPELMNKGGLDEDNEASFALSRYSELETEKSQLETQIQNLLNYDSEALLIYASGLDLPDNIIKTVYPEYLALKRDIEGLKASGLGDRHPIIVSNQKIIDRMKDDLNEGVVNLRTRLQGQLDVAIKNLEKAMTRKTETKDAALERSFDTSDYVNAKRDFETDQALLGQMKIKLMTEDIAASMPNETIVIHDQPVISNQQVSPNVMLNLVLGAVIGLIFGIGIAFFLEYLDTSIKSMEEVELYLQLPVLAVIPQNVGILHKQFGMSPDAEAYRILRTNIEYNRKNPEDNAITIVSGSAGEGKSTTLINLAYICAQGGYTILVIDADLRRPTLHKYFDISNSVGLTNYLTSEMMPEDVILQTPVDNLYFMPSGTLPADAAGILNSRRMSELILEVKQRFDMVLLDSPPILGISDASVLVNEVDLTLMIIQHRKLPKHMLVRAKKAIENVGGRLIGVVLNNVNVSSDGAYQYYTSYYSYYAPAESQIRPAVTYNTSTTSQKVSATSKSKEKDLY